MQMQAVVNRSLSNIRAWRTHILQILSLLAYVVVVEVLAAAISPNLGSDALLIVGILLAVIPAVIWMGLFYSQDRKEPEPRVFVLAVAVLGALLAGAVGQPLLTLFFRVPAWIGRDALTQVLGSILVVGFTQAFLKYAAIRFSIFYSREFDHRIDGVIYGSAVGLGYACDGYLPHPCSCSPMVVVVQPTQNGEACHLSANSHGRSGWSLLL